MDDATSAFLILMVAAFAMVLVGGFFAYTCTSGTFDMNQFDASNCFIIEGVFASNVAQTSDVTAPDAKCSDYTVLNCPPDDCQVDEVEGVCEDVGSPLAEVSCHLDQYQSSDTCPLVGCDWGGGQCAKVGKLCSHEEDVQRCENRDECHWDFFRPSYGLCLSKTQTKTPDGVCSDLNSRQTECEVLPGCSWSNGSCSSEN